MAHVIQIIIHKQWWRKILLSKKGILVIYKIANQERFLNTCIVHGLQQWSLLGKVDVENMEINAENK